MNKAERFGERCRDVMRVVFALGIVALIVFIMVGTLQAFVLSLRWWLGV